MHSVKYCESWVGGFANKVIYDAVTLYIKYFECGWETEIYSCDSED